MTKPIKKSFFARIRNNFIAGIVVLIPIGITLYLTLFFIKKIPILRTIYSAIGQMTETFTKSDNNQKSVVLFEYPRKGIWAVGFATKENQGIIKDKVKEDIVNIFVPTTPNPTSGFLLMVPKKDLIYLDITFEQASKFIVSAGTTNIS